MGVDGCLGGRAEERKERWIEIKLAATMWPGPDRANQIRDFQITTNTEHPRSFHAHCTLSLNIR